MKDEILQAQIELSRLKEAYKKIIKEIKESFYEKENYFDENPPRKPRNESAKMQAAICLAQRKSERSFDLNVRKAQYWESQDNKIQLDYWVVNQKRFENSSGIEATIIIYKKNIKLLRDTCKKIWANEVGNSYRPNTLLGFEDWLKKTSIDDIYKLMLESEIGDRIHLVTDKNLYLKDIIVIFPCKPKYLGRVIL